MHFFLGALRVKAHAGVSSGPRGLCVGLILFLYTSSENVCESVHLHRFARALAALQCDDYITERLCAGS